MLFAECSELPVRVEAVMALRSFVEELADVAPLKPVLPQLMDSIFKLMNEVSCCQHTPAHAASGRFCMAHPASLGLLCGSCLLYSSL